MGAKRLFYITPLCTRSAAEGHNGCYVNIALASAMPYPAREAQGVGYVTVRLGDLAAIACGGHPRNPRGHPRSGEWGGCPRGDGVRWEAADVARAPAPRVA